MATVTKTYAAVFNNVNPTLAAALAPTFTQFRTISGTSVAFPSLPTENSSMRGYYSFSVTLLPNEPIIYLLDGATTGLGANRYISGVFDPVQAVEKSSNIGETLLAIGTTLTALGNTQSAVIGTTASSIGSVSVAPGDVFGYVKRMWHFNEGNQNFDKSSGTWLVQDKTGTVTLAVKVIASGATNVTKI